MPGVRVDRSLASTAIILLLSAVAGGVLAEPMGGAKVDAAAPPPDAVNGAATPATPAPAAVATPMPSPNPGDSAGTGAVPTTSAIAPPAAAPGEPAATPVAVADIDAPIVEQLHNLAADKFDHIIGSKKDRTTIDAFYSSRNYAPVWITDGKANARAKAAIAYLGQVDADGLDPAD